MENVTQIDKEIRPKQTSYKETKSLQSRNWTGTYFGKDIDDRIKSLEVSCLYFMAQVEECPKSGREHLQFFIHFNSNQRLSKVQSMLPGAHCQIARDSDACIKYCSKDETRIRGPYSHGIPPGDRQKLGKKMSVKEALKLTEDELQQLPAYSYVITKKALSLVPMQPTRSDQLRGVWYHGPPGSGKSKLVHELYPGAFIKMQNKWFCNYQGQDVIIMDDLDVSRGSKEGKEIGHLLKIVTDHYECTGEIKGGFVALRHSKFVVTSNYTPEDMWDDTVMIAAIRRRFIFHLIE